MASTAAPQVQEPHRFEMAIIGGGISGIVLAIALHKRGIPCTVYEQAHGFVELAAHVSISRNAIQAMEFIDHGVLDAFHTVSTGNKWHSKKNNWFDFMDGMSRDPAPQLKPLFSMMNPNVGQNAVHRAQFLEELVHLLPKDCLHFEKRLNHILDDRIGSGKMLMKFDDGSVAEADGIVGCDGVWSRTREIMVGKDHPAAKPVYTHKYAYRGLVPMPQAIEVLGEERATNASLWVSQKLTHPALVKNSLTMSIIDGTESAHADISGRTWRNNEYDCFCDK